MQIERSSNLLRKITVLVVFCFFVLPAHAKYGGGSGTSQYPYLIYDANHMQAIGADANDWDKHFKLMADVNLADLAEPNFNVIGNGFYPFTGVFDGGGHRIWNMTHSSAGEYEVGLFGFVFNGQIEDLGLINPEIDARTNSIVGSLIGSLMDGTLSRCYAAGG